MKSLITGTVAFFGLSLIFAGASLAQDAPVGQDDIIRGLRGPQAQQSHELGPGEANRIRRARARYSPEPDRYDTPYDDSSRYAPSANYGYYPYNYNPYYYSPYGYSGRYIRSGGPVIRYSVPSPWPGLQSTFYGVVPLYGSY